MPRFPPWSLAVMLLVLVGAGASVRADVAAGVTIRNVATSEARHAGVQLTPQEAEALVLVNLVACAPGLDAPDDRTTDYTGPDSTHRYAYTVTACANGPDDYSIGSAIGAQAGNAADATAIPPVAAVRLGASVTVDGSTATTLLVPGDGTDDGELAGLAVGDMVVIAGEVRTVTALLEPATGPSSIALDAPLAAAPAAGLRVTERTTVFVDVVSGTGDGSHVLVDVDTTVSNSGGTSSDEVRSTFLDNGERTPSTIDLLRYAGTASSTPGLPLTTASCSTGGSPAGPFLPLADPTLLDGSPLTLPDVVGTFDAALLKRGEPLVLRVVDPDQNRDPAVNETIDVTLAVSDGAERELIRLLETGPNSGEFAGVIQIGSGVGVPYDCVLQLSTGETLDAIYVDEDDGSDTAVARALVDPAGRVFDDATGAAIDGASVTLIDTVTGSPAVVLGDDGVSTFPATVTSGGTAVDASGATYDFAAGTFRFPVVPPGSYRLEVVPPAVYGFPSSEPDATLQMLPGAPYAVVVGSRGEPFAVGPAPVVLVDVPLTSLAEDPFVTKTAERPTAAIGDLLSYSVVVQNPGTVDDPDIVVDDRLPPGFRYRAGSARLGGTMLADPTIGDDGRSLRFAIGPLDAGGSVTLRYVVEIAAGTPTGPATNVVTAGGNSSRATVVVRDELLRDRSILVGRVAAGDCEGGPAVGVGDVRIWLEDGTFVDTDEDGRWHIEGLHPGLHVVQVDLETLPDRYEIAEPCRTSSRFAGRAWSRFVELRPGTLWRTDFRLRERPAPETVVEATHRVVPLAGERRRVELTVRHDGRVALDSLRLAVRADPAAVVDGSGATLDGRTSAPETTVIGRVWTLDPERLAQTVAFEVDGAGDLGAIGSYVVRFASVGTPDGRTGPGRIAVGDAGSAPPVTGRAVGTWDPPEPDDAANATAPLGLLEPAEGARTVRATTDVRARLARGLTARLLVDGEPVADDRLGLRIVDGETGSTLYGWVAVDLGPPGAHRIVLQGLDPQGDVAVEHTATVERTGRVQSIRVVDTSGNVADGRTPVTARLELLDAAGRTIPAALGFEILEGELRPWVADHERARLVDAGATRAATVEDDGTLRFAPVERSGRYTVVLRHETLVRRLTIDVAPPDRDWIVVGFAEGTLAHRSLEGAMEPFAADGSDETDDLDGNVALFAKGRVPGGWLLTLAYDGTGRGTGADGVEKTIDPGSYYTVYGDAAEQRYDAPSRRRLYVRLERAKYMALFGDFRSGLTAGELTRYDRALTGAFTRYDGGRVSFVLFGSETGDRFVRDEIRGTGTSGPYRLTRRPMVINSERVRIETRDRFRSERILETRSLTRHLDYDVDYDAGELTFKRPVAGRSDLLDPIFVVVDYETHDDAGDALTAGGRLAWHDEAGRFELGATAIDEGREGLEDGRLHGVDLRWEPVDGTVIRAEAAHSSGGPTSDPTAPSPDGGEGTAWLAEVSHTTGRLAATATIREQEREFGLGHQNGSEAGTRKAGVDVRYEAGERLAASGEAFRQENLDSGAVRDVVAAQVELRRDDWDLRGGGRHAADRAGNGERFRSSLLTAGGRYRIDDGRWLLRADVEAGLGGGERSGDYPDRLIVGSDWRIVPTLTLFGEQELTSGGTRSNTTRLGLKSEPWRGGRLDGALENSGLRDAARTFALLGLQQSWRIGERWAVDASLDRVSTIDAGDAPPFDVDTPPASGTRLDDSSAVSLGSSYQRDGWSWSSRFEWREADREDRTSLTSGLYRELGDGAALAAQAELWSSSLPGGTTEDAGRLRLDAVRRADGSRWTLFDRLELRADERTAGGVTTTSRALVNNVDANVVLGGRTQLSLQGGLKLVEQTIDDVPFDATTWLAGFELRHDLTERWDVGGHAHLLTSAGTGTSRRSWGLSLGRSLGTNIWLSVGYNVEGFRDDDFTAADATAEGPLLRFRFKFDQESLRSLVERSRIGNRPGPPDAP